MSESNLSDELLGGRRRTIGLIYGTAMLERMDEQILPAVYAFIGASWSASPSQLGALTLARALVQALSSPIGGLLGHYCDRIKVTAAGCFVWAIMTTFFGCARTLNQGIAAWAINGLGLAMVIPCGQSLVADYYVAAERGKAFGGLSLTAAVGGMLGSVYATNMGGSYVAGIDGWRVVFLSVAAVSAAIGALTLLAARDPLYTRGGKRERPLRGGLASLWADVRQLLTTPTFCVLIGQGILGTIPWTALVFLTLYLQLIGMSDLHAGSLMALFLAGTALGGLLGGYIGDRAAAQYPNHGRIFVAQFSVSLGVPFSLLLIKSLPLNGQPQSVAQYALLLFTGGLMMSWTPPALNNPVMAEIVPAHCRSLIFAFDRSFEGALASCAAPLVGLLAERWFGFSGAASRSQSTEKDLANASALGSALLFFCLVPWIGTLLVYTGLHWTYPRDRARIARAETMRVRRMGSSAYRGTLNGDPERAFRGPEDANAGGELESLRRRGTDSTGIALSQALGIT